MSKPKMRSPAFQFYPRQFAGDDAVMAMDLDTVGAHVLLMCAAAASPECHRIGTGSAPDGSRRDAGERAIRNRLRNPSEEDWQRIKGQLLSGAWKISDDGQWWEQDGLRRTFEKQRAFSKEQQDRANKRYGNSGESEPGYITETTPEDHRNAADGYAGDLPVSCSSSASAPKGEELSSKAEPSDDPSLLSALADVWKHYIEQTERDQRLYTFTPKRKRTGLARLRECLRKTNGDVEKAAQLMIAAVDALSASDWHMGRDPKTNGRRYCDWIDHLFGNYEKLEKWWNV
jgi:hypothetical protein